MARRLEDLPEVAAAFGDGRISYSKVRAVTRVAAPDDGVEWVELARHSSAAQLEKIVRGVRRARANEAAEADPEAAAWRLRTRTRFDDNGNFVLTITGPAQHLPVLQAGIAAKRAELQRERDAAPVDDVAAPEPEAQRQPELEALTDASAEAPVVPDDGSDLDEQAPGWPAGTTRRDVQAASTAFVDAQRQHAAEEGNVTGAPPSADAAPGHAPPAPVVEHVGASAEAPECTEVSDAEALLAMAQEALSAEHAARPAIARRRRRPQLTAQVDPLSGWARQPNGELLPPSSLRGVMKTLPGRGGVLRLRPVTAADLRRHDLGRTQREANAALRELLGSIDGERCRFPGCTRHKKLHAHHVVHWSDGGETNLDNLVLVCSRHHTLIHAQGFALLLHSDRRLEVRSPDGAAILHHPAQPWSDVAALAHGPGARVLPDTLPPDHCDARMELGYVVSVLLAQAS